MKSYLVIILCVFLLFASLVLAEEPVDQVIEKSSSEEVLASEETKTNEEGEEGVAAVATTPAPIPSSWEVWQQLYAAWSQKTELPAELFAANARVEDAAAPGASTVEQVQRAWAELGWQLQELSEPQLIFGSATAVGQPVDGRFKVSALSSTTGRRYEGFYSAFLETNQQGLITRAVVRAESPLALADALRENTPAAHFEHFLAAYDSGVPQLFLKAVSSDFSVTFHGFEDLLPHGQGPFSFGSPEEIANTQAALGDSRFSNHKFLSPILFSQAEDGSSQVTAEVQWDWQLPGPSPLASGRKTTVLLKHLVSINPDGRVSAQDLYLLSANFLRGLLADPKKYKHDKDHHKEDKHSHHHHDKEKKEKDKEKEDKPKEKRDEKEDKQKKDKKKQVPTASP